MFKYLNWINKDINEMIKFVTRLIIISCYVIVRHVRIGMYVVRVSNITKGLYRILLKTSSIIILSDKNHIYI